ncbi:MAG: ABC transporter ATP-binding protein [Deltaproteobacteria bacterium RBG_13_51_10]|nr:MAG: ABC transporter ATP-binding protein [Deltaproteobacteria bacterium RBG_13_51_10]
MGCALKLENIHKDFSGLQVLKGIHLEIKEGERHAIIGPNGAGKSTLFNIITGLYKPSKGRLLFREKDITGWPIHKISRMKISRSFQITNLYPRMTVFENVRNAVISKLNRRFDWLHLLDNDQEINEETERILSLLSLEGVRNFLAAELSYGAQRELEIALTLARDPILIMLDEPTAGLNTEETRKVVEIIRRVTERKTLVIVEHDMEVVFSLASRITVLNYGRILATGAPDEVRENEEVKNAYLGKKQYVTRSQ